MEHIVSIIAGIKEGGDLGEGGFNSLMGAECRERKHASPKKWGVVSKEGGDA